MCKFLCKFGAIIDRAYGRLLNKLVAAAKYLKSENAALPVHKDFHRPYPGTRFDFIGIGH